jgi:hypothetical protein
MQKPVFHLYMLLCLQTWSNATWMPAIDVGPNLNFNHLSHITKPHFHMLQDLPFSGQEAHVNDRDSFHLLNTNFSQAGGRTPNDEIKYRTHLDTETAGTGQPQFNATSAILKSNSKQVRWDTSTGKRQEKSLHCYSYT